MIKRKKKSERTIKVIKIQVIFFFVFVSQLLVKDIAAVEILPYLYLAVHKKKILFLKDFERYVEDFSPHELQLNSSISTRV